MEEVAMNDLNKLADKMAKFYKKWAQKNFENVDKKTCSIYRELASIHGHLDESVDDKLKVMIAATKRAIDKLGDFSWDETVTCLMQSPVLKLIDESRVSISKNLDNNKFNVFQTNAPPDSDVVRDWFRELTKDEYILMDPDINTNIILAQYRAPCTCNSLLTYLFTSEKKDLIDMGVLCYPDTKSPHIKLYHIRLTAWRVFSALTETHGVIGSFECIEFKQRDYIITELSEETTAKAIADVDSLKLEKA